MKTPIKLIWKVEILKLIKRNDYLSMLAILGIGILFAASAMSNSYVGPTGQNALFWAVTQILNASIFFIAPIIMAFAGTRILSTELENGSISLLNYRIRNRKNMYIGKSLAITSFSVLIFLVSSASNIFFYYVFVCQNQQYATVDFIGENAQLLSYVLIATFFSSYFLVVQYALFLGTYLKPTLTIGCVFFTVLVVHNTFNLPLIRYFNPWYYIIELSNDVVNTTDKINTQGININSLFISHIVLCIGYAIIFNLLGMKKLEKRDL
ncbi:ABC transporter permease [Anaerocolumna sp. MB42-C2]|uniref:ABC transporter permease n=1 Tax=Anaerocolumna sp. MB42-C2 TaxID=3070997 RepID=UPI0027E0B7D4|nr:ABC transporter permease [Anaerocolumna sp. MB42-C2]WMJ89084.1 ABC transporter permease [Anaerocolumna sp. MB42-C2]